MGRKAGRNLNWPNFNRFWQVL